MIRRTLGAPFGGTTRAGQYGFDWSACRLISPPNFGGGGGRYLPSIVVVAPGEPGVPVVCCADVGTIVNRVKAAVDSNSADFFMTISLGPRPASEMGYSRQGVRLDVDLDQRRSAQGHERQNSK